MDLAAFLVDTMIRFRLRRSHRYIYYVALREAMYDHKVLPDMTGTRPDSTISLVRFDPVKEMDILRVRSWNNTTGCTTVLSCCCSRTDTHTLRQVQIPLGLWNLLELH